MIKSHKKEKKDRKVLFYIAKTPKCGIIHIMKLNKKYINIISVFLTILVSCTIIILINKIPEKIILENNIEISDNFKLKIKGNETKIIKKVESKSNNIILCVDNNIYLTNINYNETICLDDDKNSKKYVAKENFLIEKNKVTNYIEENYKNSLVIFNETRELSSNYRVVIAISEN